MNGYELSRKWFDWCFENPELISPNHSALYFFAVEHCNRMGWKKKFGFPTTMVKDAIGIKSYNTYIKTLNDLVNWGFIEMIERSKNQYSSNIIALSFFDKALDKALDKATVKHVTKQRESNDSINKQLTIKHKNKSIIDNTLMSEIKISDDKKFFIIKNEKIEASNNEIEYFTIAEKFRNLFIENQENVKAPTTHQNNAKYKNYVTQVRLIIEKDKVTLEQLREAYRYLKSEEGWWWQTNVLSIDSLRRQIPTLVAKKNYKPKKEVKPHSGI